jgi:DNA repair protein RadC
LQRVDGHLKSSVEKPESNRPRKRRVCEWRITTVRLCPTPEEMCLCDTPQKAADYWRLHIEGHPFFDQERECFVVLCLNTKLRIRGHHFVSVGSLNESIVHPREAFRIAVLSAAYGVVFIHNHPSGEPQPSEADMRMTRRLVAAAEILNIKLVDHVIIGHQRHISLREMGVI